MKFQRVIIILLSIIFFLTSLTFYLNRVIFPQLVKKVAIEHIEEVLKRKVEIGSIHFSWVRGIIIDKIKIYEKDSDSVFAQAEQVSFGIIIFPGLKHYRITIPYINVSSPSAHFMRSGETAWNFSDLYTPSPETRSMAQASSTKTQKAPAFEIAWGGISINDGKFLVEDETSPHPWSEYFDNINLKLSLSYKGISYDFTADIPRKKGFVGATVYYEPLTRNTQAQIHLKNIDTASYLSLINIPDVHLNNGIIKNIDLNINYSQDKTSAQGDVLMKDLDITNHDQSFKGDIEIRGLDAQYQNGAITAHGQIALNNIETKVPGLLAAGSVQTRVNEFEMTKEGVNFVGSICAQNIKVSLKDRQVQVDDVNLESIKIKKDKDGIQSVGSISTKGLFVQWPNQQLGGDISLKSVTMHMQDENNIILTGELRADNFATRINDKNFSSQHILLENAQLNILDQKNITLNAKLTLEQMMLVLGRNSMSSSSVKTDKFLFNWDDGIIKLSTNLNATEGKLVLEKNKIIKADPQLEISLQMPIDAPQELTYKGSVTLSDGSIQGFAPIQTLDNVELDADFQNNEATINALSVYILDTNVRINGSVKNFDHPRLNIVAEADDLNLAKIKDVIPQVVRQYDLIFKGSSFVKLKFAGLASDPLSGNILAVASVKNVSVYSSKLHQQIKNITGILEATAKTLKWRDTTAIYQGHQYSLSGTVQNLKNPKIYFTLDGPNLALSANLVKFKDLIRINTLTGKYFDAAFNCKGNIALPARKEPLFEINSNMTLLLEDLMKTLPAPQKKAIGPLNPTGLITITADLKGSALDWKNYQLNASISSPAITLKGYRLTDMKIDISQDKGKVKNMVFDGKFYDGTIHAVGSLNLFQNGLPYTLALNIANTDLHKLKIDSPLKMEEIDGKFFLTALAHGTVADFKNNLYATGSLAIRDGYLAEFNLFKGLLSVLNDALRLGQVEITDVEGNFTIDNQRINTDNLRLKGPTIVLLSKGWVNFDQMCDLDMTVDLSSGVVPAIANDVLSTLNIRIYDKITDPKFKKKISVPQVINTLLKNLLE